LQAENDRLRGAVEGDSADELMLLTGQLEDARQAKAEYERDYVEAKAKLADMESELADVRERLRAAESERLNMRGETTVSIEVCFDLMIVLYANASDHIIIQYITAEIRFMDVNQLPVITLLSLVRVVHTDCLHIIIFSRIFVLIVC